MSVTAQSGEDARVKTRSHVTTALATFAVTAIASLMLMPASVDAASATFVKIQDYKNKSKNGQASVVDNRLLVGDGAGPVTVDGSVRIDGPVAVTGSLSTTASPSTPETLGCTGQTIQGFSGCMMRVPDGARMTIETVSASVTLPTDDGATVQLGVTTAGVLRYYQVALARTRSAASTDSYTTANPNLVLHPDPGSLVEFEVYATSQRAGLSSWIAISGYRG